MLNCDQLQELGRFKLLMRKMHNQSVQLEKFLMDFEYQTTMLDIAEQLDENDLDNDELMMLSLTLRSRFGRLGQADEAYAAIVAVAEPAPKAVPVAPVVVVEEKVEATTASTVAANSVALLRNIGQSLSSTISAASASMGQQVAAKSDDLTHNLEEQASDKPRYIMSLR